MHLDYHLAIASTGAYIQFDCIGTMGSLGIAEDTHLLETLISHIRTLVDRGYVDQLLISQDVCRKSTLTAYAGNGYAYLLEHFVPRMEQAGIDREVVETILIDNPARMLSRGPEGHHSAATCRTCPGRWRKLLGKF